MTQAQHTPGPWGFGLSYAIVDASGYKVCTVATWRNQEEIRANGRLLAAAPKLLDALKRLRKAETASCGEWTAALANADSVIADATGSAT